MQLSEILQTLESEHGIGPWTQNEDGAVSLMSDAIEISLIPIGETDSILLYAPVAPMSENGAEELACVLLQVNHRFGAEETASFALHPEEKTYVLQRLLSCDTLEPDDFATALLDLVALAKKWKPLIEEYKPKLEEKDTEEPVAPDIPLNWVAV